MKIAYKHLLNFLVDKPDIEELSSKLLQLGHEHEINDSIFDIEFTPNRGDCLSLLGLARDLNVFYKTNLDVVSYPDEIPILDLNFKNKAKDQCPKISFLNIEIRGKVSKYKNYLESYFQDLQINKNNFFTDVSNYVAYEMGQPTHSYDFSLLGDDITLDQVYGNYEFKTLLGNVVDLKESNLVFTSEGKIINLSGIMGGAETACTKQTTNSLIECAYFRPESISGKAVKYNLNSDASHKFERGTDHKCHEKVLRRFIQIVSEHAEIIKLELYVNNHNLEDIELDFNLMKINKILGINSTKEDFKDVLTKLGFDVREILKVPSFRSDINHQNDLAEELARVIGYDNIPKSPINLKPATHELSLTNEDLLKHYLINKGFIEVINSPFCAISNSSSIKVDNPLDSNREYIRTNLLDSLVENTIFNEKRQKDSIKLFEISDIYTYKGGIKKDKTLAIIVSGRIGQNYRDFSKKLDNKYLINLFKDINIDIDKLIVNIDRGKVDSKIKTPIYAFEIKMDDLTLTALNKNFSKTSNNFVRYRPISEFPSSYRDLSFSIKDPEKIEEVISILSSFNSELIKSSYMFDFYDNKKSGESKIGFRFIFQSQIRTLTDNEIDNEIDKIIKPVLLVNSVFLPGA